MALLSTDKRNEYLKALGFKDVLSFQKKAFHRKQDIDGIYGQDTDNALRTWYNVYKYTKNFKPEEFRCECGKYCCGYPTYMRPEILSALQAIRSHWGKPITVTCGLRCSGYNKALNGSISNSSHLTGLAVDFYQKGVTDTLANRKSSIKWIKKLANFNYAYGNGINSVGSSTNAPYMGNALHIDFVKGKVVEPSENKATKNEKVSETKVEKNTKTPNEQAIDSAVKWAKKHVGMNYKKYDTTDHKCPICHPDTKVKGFNCIGFVCACYAHGAGDKKMLSNCKKNNGAGLGNNATLNKNVLSNWKKHNGDDWKLITNGGKFGGARLSKDKLKKGDVLICYDSNGVYKHVALYIGSGKIIDSNSGKGVKIRNYSDLNSRPTRALRYTGKGKF